MLDSWIGAEIARAACTKGFGWPRNHQLITLGVDHAAGVEPSSLARSVSASPFSIISDGCFNSPSRLWFTRRVHHIQPVREEALTLGRQKIAFFIDAFGISWATNFEDGAQRALARDRRAATSGAEGDWMPATRRVRPQP